MALPLSPQVFVILAALVEESAGLHYGPDDRELFAEKVSVRAVEEGFESLLDYYYFMRYDAGGATELARLVESLVVHETFFFREREALDWLVQRFLPARCAAKGRARIWSSACATGEEPLTLAMLVAEAGLADRVDIVATDISERALARAREGVFSPRALRDGANTPPFVDRYLVKRAGRLFVQPELYRSIEWRRVNLTVEDEVAALGAFDAVICRNVLIYFSETTAERVVTRLAQRLVPDGVLLVGVSESLLRFGAAVRCEERGGVFIYQPVSC